MGRPFATVKPGERGPDAMLARLGTNESVRLHRVLRNTGRFNVLVFAGRPKSNLSALRSFHTETMALATRFSTAERFVTYTTLIAGQGVGGEECLGVRPLGMSWFDHSGDAHSAYGVDVEAGAVVILRPDGHVGAVLSLVEEGSLVEYFAGFILT
jgi:phenol 2-monooxygenase